MAIPIFKTKEDISFVPSKKTVDMEPFSAIAGEEIPPPYRHSYPLVNRLPKEIRKHIFDVREPKPKDNKAGPNVPTPPPTEKQPGGKYRDGV